MLTKALRASPQIKSLNPLWEPESPQNNPATTNLNRPICGPLRAHQGWEAALQLLPREIKGGRAKNPRKGGGADQDFEPI